jgi:large subunit ribosomal protein L10
LDRQGKAQVIDSLQQVAQRAQLMVMVDYRGLTVAEMNGLRRTLDTSGQCEFMVAKNTLTRRAIAGTNFAVVAERLTGTNALLFAFDDPVSPVKALLEAAKTLPKLELRGGVFAGKLITADQLKDLAKMPSKQEAQGMLAGVLAAPARQLACVLAAIPRSLANVLVAVKDNKAKQAA